MTIKTATLNGVATIEIARPEKKNALTMAMYQAMADALAAAGADPAVRAVLITGQPGLFTSGNDIEDFMQRPPQSQDSPVSRFMNALLDSDKPVVAAVTGAAVGIGTTMLLHCDLVYVSDEARLAMPFVSLGLVPEFASSAVIPALIGHPRAAERLLLGDPFSGADAVDCGIANARAAGQRSGEPCAANRRALQCAAAGSRSRNQAAAARAAAGAAARGDGRRERAVQDPAAQPRGDRGFPGLFPEAQARLQQVKF